MLHEHLTKAGIIGVNETSKAPRSDIQHIEEDADSEATGKKCVICWELRTARAIEQSIVVHVGVYPRFFLGVYPAFDLQIAAIVQW
jgi:hypothetical protein